MRRLHRVVLLVGLVAVAPVLAGCEDFDADKFDVFGINQKKKLPGERKELFPEGVPGVTQGIPPEYMKGNQPPPETAQTLPADQSNPAAAAVPNKKTAAVEPEPEPKPKPKRKPKPRTALQPPAAQTTTSQQQPAPWPQQEPQAAPQQSQAPWPAPQGQATTAAPWPSAPAPGTFSR